MPSVSFKPDYAKDPDARRQKTTFNGRGTMNGLRMFIRPNAKGLVEDNVFYSQRSHGPMYRWHYEEQLGRWNGARVDTSAWISHELCTARWQSVPETLKAKLIEHYIE